MRQHVNVPVVKKISTYCSKCNGRHWDPSDNAKTQANAKAEFGITPNACVNGNGGIVHCPHVLGIL